MREMLFRGKRIDNGEWISGSNILTLDGKELVYIVPNGDLVDAREDQNGNIKFLQPHNALYKVDPETVGQYTSLTDKNGKKIFEGDIVRNHNGGVYEFAFIKQYSRFALRRPGTVFGWSNPKLCEVIGNIHDNPELLEKDGVDIRGGETID